MRDPHKVKQAQELHAKGYTIRQIARRINTQYGTAKRYVDPAYDELLRERGRKLKEKYRGTCEICGRSTSYSGRGGVRGSPRCREHVYVGRKRWTQESVIKAIQRWAEEYGHPPSAPDWNAARSKAERGEGYPSATSVYGSHGAFEKWGDAIEAAGFARPKTLYSGEWRELVWTKERTLEALRRHAVNGVAPRSQEWNRGGPNRPTTTWVSHIFGSWTNACHEAGLLTHQEAYFHGRSLAPYKRPDLKVIERRYDSDLIGKQLAFVQRIMEDHVPRRFLAQQLWRPWGFNSSNHFRNWLASRGIQELPGYPYLLTRRQLTREELEEARELSPAVQKQESEV